jgi:predicted ATPase
MATYQAILLQIIFASLKDTHSQVDIQLARTISTSCSSLLTTLAETCLRKNMFFYPEILADLQFSLPDSDELWNATSDLAARLAEDGPLYYDNNNTEANWISQSARLLQRHDMTFDWL